MQQTRCPTPSAEALGAPRRPPQPVISFVSHLQTFVRFAGDTNSRIRPRHPSVLASNLLRTRRLRPPGV